MSSDQATIIQMIISWKSVTLVRIWCDNCNQPLDRSPVRCSRGAHVVGGLWLLRKYEWTYSDVNIIPTVCWLKCSQIDARTRGTSGKHFRHLRRVLIDLITSWTYLTRGNALYLLGQAHCCKPSVSAVLSEGGNRRHHKLMEMRTRWCPLLVCICYPLSHNPCLRSSIRFMINVRIDGLYSLYDRVNNTKSNGLWEANYTPNLGSLSQIFQLLSGEML